jgi:hypothetical protein
LVALTYVAAVDDPGRFKKSKDDLARKAGQGRRADRAPRPLRGLPAGEVAVPRALFAVILHRIERLRGPPVVAAV